MEVRVQGINTNIFWKSAILPAGVLAIFFLGWIDLITGYEMSFSIFYLLPIMAVLWWGSKAAALLLAVLGGGVWLAADLLSGNAYSNPVIPIWNMIMRLGFFVIVVFLGAGFKKELDMEKSLARTDPLTGAANARFLIEQGTIEIGRATRFNRMLSLVYLDLDDFKRINDQWGHDCGDHLLRSLAGRVKELIRGYDILARMGGDEFVILLPETDAAQARAVLEKLQLSLREFFEETGGGVTFSAGLATFMRPPKSMDQAIKIADDLMYTAKKAGKNAVECRIVDES